MATTAYAHFRYERPGFAFAVYPDRVVVTRCTYLRTQTIIHLIGRIALLEIQGAPARLHIVMDDGSRAAYELMGQVAAAHDAITRLQ